MFTVHRQEFSPALPHRSCGQLTGRDQNFLICQSDSFPGLDGLIGRHQSRSPVGGGQNDVNLGVRGGLDLPAHPTGDLNKLRGSKISQPLAQGRDTV